MKEKILFGLLGVFVILIVWHIVSSFGVINELFLPTPIEVFLEFVHVIVTGEIFPHIWATLYRTIAGFLIGSVVGVSIGLVMGYHKKIYNLTEFIVDFFRSIPATALFPLFLLFFGIGDEAKVAVVVFSTSLIIIVNTMYGVKHRSQVRANFAKTLGFSRFNLFSKVVLPDASPHIFAGLRIAISIALIIVVVSEMFIGTTFGLGRVIMDAQLVYRIPEMYVAIILTGAIGYLLNCIVLFIERRMVHWAGK